MTHFVRKSSKYVLLQLASKTLSAFTQLYCIYVFSHRFPSGAADVVFLLIGYGIWLQTLELGLSQVIQNKLNTRLFTVSSASTLLLFHFFFVLLLGFFFLVFPELLIPLHPQSTSLGTIRAFASGAFLTVLYSNLLIAQRYLLVINKGFQASMYNVLQCIFAVTSLFFIGISHIDLTLCIWMYFGAPFIAFLPVLIKLYSRGFGSISKSIKVFHRNHKSIFSFAGLTVLSSLYAGADYFFLSQLRSDSIVSSYHFSVRAFFIAYVGYFSYLQYSARRFTFHTSSRHQVFSVLQKTLKLGTAAIIATLLLISLLHHLGLFRLLGLESLLNYPILFIVSIYFFARLLRDSSLVIFWNYDWKTKLYCVHIAEVVVGFILLKYLTSLHGVFGISLAMTLVSFMTFVLLLIAAKSPLKVTREIPNVNI